MTRGLLYLSKLGCDIYIPTLPTIIHVAFPATAVRDMDVLNPDELANALKTAFVQNKVVAPVTFSLILSKTVLFIKEFPRYDIKAQAKGEPAATPPALKPGEPEPHQMTAVERDQAISDQEKAIQSFIDHVPFEDVTSKVLTMPAAKVVAATNGELFKSIKETVTTLGNTVDLVLPETLFSTVQVGAQLTPQIAQEILSREDTYKQHNFLNTPVTTSEKQETATHTQKKEQPSNKRVILLAGVFVLLIIIMIVMYYLTYMTPQPKKKSVTQISPVSKVSVAPTSTHSPSQSATSSASLSSLKVQLTTDTQSASFAATLKKGLSALGLTDISQSQSTMTSGRSLIIFAPTVPTDIREKVLGLVKTVDPSVTTQENTAAVSPIFISIGSH